MFENSQFKIIHDLISFPVSWSNKLRKGYFGYLINFKLILKWYFTWISLSNVPWKMLCQNFIFWDKFWYLLQILPSLTILIKYLINAKIKREREREIHPMSLHVSISVFIILIDWLTNWLNHQPTCLPTHNFHYNIILLIGFSRDTFC